MDDNEIFMTRRRLVWPLISFLLIIAFLWLAGIVFPPAHPSTANSSALKSLYASGELGNYLIVFAIGLMVGATELMARYADDPFKPLVSKPGFYYFTINGGSTILAYYLVTHLGVDVQATTAGKPPVRDVSRQISEILFASLGAMAFFRSGFFTMRLGDGDVAVGPNLILQIVLQALDRAYDRARAEPRSVLVSQIMGGVSFEAAREALPMICFNLMQNVTEEEREAVGTEVAALTDKSSMSDESRVMNLGLMLLNLVGERTLRSAVNALGPTIQGFRTVDADLMLSLAAVPPKVALDQLPTACNTLAHDSLKLTDPTNLVSEIKAMSVSDDAKAMLALYRVVRQFGLVTVRIAITALKDSQPAPIPPAPPLPAASPAPAPKPPPSVN